MYLLACYLDYPRNFNTSFRQLTEDDNELDFVDSLQPPTKKITQYPLHKIESGSSSALKGKVTTEVGMGLMPSKVSNIHLREKHMAGQAGCS